MSLWNLVITEKFGGIIITNFKHNLAIAIDNRNIVLKNF